MAERMTDDELTAKVAELRGLLKRYVAERAALRRMVGQLQDLYIKTMEGKHLSDEGAALLVEADNLLHPPPTDPESLARISWDGGAREVTDIMRASPSMSASEAQQWIDKFNAEAEAENQL